MLRLINISNSESAISPGAYTFARLQPGQVAQFRQMNAMFADAFEDPGSYASKPPGDEYLQGLLQKSHVIALAAFEGPNIVAGMVAYVLDKFEQERSEIYIYDLAVTEVHRRKGIARALMAELKKIAQELGAWVIYVQADKEDEDLPARRLYESMGEREDVFHYDIAVK